MSVTLTRCYDMMLTFWRIANTNLSCIIVPGQVSGRKGSRWPNYCSIRKVNQRVEPEAIWDPSPYQKLNFDGVCVISIFFVKVSSFVATLIFKLLYIQPRSTKFGHWIYFCVHVAGRKTFEGIYNLYLPCEQCQVCGSGPCHNEDEKQKQRYWKWYVSPRPCSRMMGADKRPLLSHPDTSFSMTKNALEHYN